MDRLRALTLPAVGGVRDGLIDVARAYEHNGFSPDEVVGLYPHLSPGDVHTALAFYYDRIDEFRSNASPSASA